MIESREITQGERNEREAHRKKASDLVFAVIIRSLSTGRNEDRRGGKDQGFSN